MAAPLQGCWIALVVTYLLGTLAAVFAMHLTLAITWPQ